MAYSDHAIQAARDELLIEVAYDADMIRKVHKLRYQVYCIDNQYESGSFGLERDYYDLNSTHVLVSSKKTGEALGAARLVRPVFSERVNEMLPMTMVCTARVLDGFPLDSTVELSRFAVARERHGVSPEAAAMIRLAIIRGIVRVSRRESVTHWVVLLTPALRRLLAASGIRMDAIGPEVQHRGVRLSVGARLHSILMGMRDECPALWAYVTGG